MALTFEAPEEIEAKAIDFAIELFFERPGMLDMRGHGQENNSGLKPFCIEILLKNCGKRTSEYLDVHSNILSKWFVQIWKRMVVKCLCFLSDSCIDQKQSLLKTWS